MKEAHFTLPISHLAYASHAGASPGAGTQVEQWRSEENHWCLPSGRKPPLQEQTPRGFLSNSQWKHLYLLSFLLLKLNPTIQGVGTWNHWAGLAASTSLRSHRPFGRQRAGTSVSGQQGAFFFLDWKPEAADTFIRIPFLSIWSRNLIQTYGSLNPGWKWTLFFLNKFIYFISFILFLALLGLCCCEWAFL